MTNVISTYLDSTLTGQREALRRFERACALELEHRRTLAAENAVQPSATLGLPEPQRDAGKSEGEPVT